MALGTGLYELGLGFAALTPWGAAIYGPAPLHFKSSAILLGMGAAFGGIGRAIPGGGGGKGGNDQSSSPDYRTISSTLDTSKITSNREQSNQQLQLTINRLQESVTAMTGASQSLESRINTQPAGVIVASGIKSNPGLIGNQALADIKRNSSLKVETGKALGIS